MIDYGIRRPLWPIAATRRVSMIAALGLGICITNWLEHYAPAYQLYGQEITKVETHAFEDIVREVNDDIPRTITGVLAFHGCPHGLFHGERLFFANGGASILRPHAPY